MAFRWDAVSWPVFFFGLSTPLQPFFLALLSRYYFSPPFFLEQRLPTPIGADDLLAAPFFFPRYLPVFP